MEEGCRKMPPGETLDEIKDPPPPANGEVPAQEPPSPDAPEGVAPPAESRVASGGGSFARDVGYVGFATFLSRILGLLREQTFAGLFGAGTYTDAFNAAFKIPNLLRDLFAEGALSSAFVPTFTEYHKTRSPEETQRLVNVVMTVLLAVLFVISLAGVYYASDIVSWIAPGFEKVPGKVAMTVGMTRIMIPFLLLVATAAIFMGILNSLGYFFVPAFAPALFNVGMILSGFILCPVFGWLGYNPITGMAVGVLIGGLMQMGVQYRKLRALGFSFRPAADLGHPGFRHVAWLMLPATIGLAATQVNIFINTNLASSLAEGAISYLNYSFRLMQLPIGIFGVAIASVTLPLISAQIARGERDKLAETITNSMSLVFLLTIPATFGLIFLKEPIISLLYEHGKFTRQDTLNTGHALVGYSIGLFGYSAVKILAPIFYAFNETKVPVLASVSSVACNIVLNFILVEKYSYFGLALATSVTMILNFAILFIFIRRRVREISVAKIAAAFLKITFVSLVMGVFLFYLYDGIFLNMKSAFFGFDTLFNLFTLSVLIPAGVYIMFAAGRRVGVAELETLAKVIDAKLARIRDSVMARAGGEGPQE